MNGFPNAAQKRFHDNLREMYSKNGQLHHIVGARRKMKGFVKPGEWLVIFIPVDVHEQIGCHEIDFQGEKEIFFKQKKHFELYFDEPYPVPKELLAHFESMLNKHAVVKF